MPLLIFDSPPPELLLSWTYQKDPCSLLLSMFVYKSRKRERESRVCYTVSLIVNCAPQCAAPTFTTNFPVALAIIAAFKMQYI